VGSDWYSAAEHATRTGQIAEMNIVRESQNYAVRLAEHCTASADHRLTTKKRRMMNGINRNRFRKESIQIGVFLYLFSY